MKNKASDDDDTLNKGLEDLVQCSACSRRMHQEVVFIKHPKVCRQNPTNKRNVYVFDMIQYHSINVGNKIIPVPNLSSINVKQSTNVNVRPSETRSIKRNHQSDSLVPSNECFRINDLLSIFTISRQHFDQY